MEVLWGREGVGGRGWGRRMGRVKTKSGRSVGAAVGGGWGIQIFEREAVPTGIPRRSRNGGGGVMATTTSTEDYRAMNEGNVS